MKIQCTKELLKVMKREPDPVPQGEDDNPFYTWNANIIRLGRNRMMILQNSLTRCVIVLYRPMAKDFANLEDRISEAIRLLFGHLGIPESKIEAYLNNAGDFIVTKSGSRKELGRLIHIIKDFKRSPIIQYYILPDSLYQPEVDLELSDVFLWITEDKRVISAIDCTQEQFGDIS